jgi:hypothetical protein
MTPFAKQAWCDGRLLIADVVEARGAWGRALGLMGRRALPAGRALLLRPCGAIHTLFMRFPIDAIFLDADDRVLRVARNLHPWRPAVAARGARAVLEASSGHLPPDIPRPGSLIVWRDPREPPNSPNA